MSMTPKLLCTATHATVGMTASGAELTRRVCILSRDHDSDHLDGLGISWRDMPDDAINHPKHYNSHPSGIECITVAEWHNFNIGNVLKYIWRAGLKPNKVDVTTLGDAARVFVDGTSDPLTDLRKARWYLDREIQRLEKTK